MQDIQVPVIGIIHSPFTDLENMPIQPVGAGEVMGSAVLSPEFAEGLKDLEGFSHIYLLYFFHRACRSEMRVVPYMDREERGVFATRSPLRPAHLGLSIVELVAVEASLLHLRGVDVLDGTPLLDIKPYIPAFDHREEVRTGWMQRDRASVVRMRSDQRFV